MTEPAPLPALPEISPHDHPEPRTYLWTGVEIRWIRQFAENYARAAIAAQTAPVAQQAAAPQKPDGKLHADGYFTWHRRDGYVLDRRLPCDFYLAPPAAHAQQPAPLPPYRVSELLVEAGYSNAQECADFINGLRHGERAHGIPAPTTDTGEKA